MKLIDIIKEDSTYSKDFNQLILVLLDKTNVNIRSVGRMNNRNLFIILVQLITTYEIDNDFYPAIKQLYDTIIKLDKKGLTLKDVKDVILYDCKD